MTIPEFFLDGRNKGGMVETWALDEVGRGAYWELSSTSGRGLLIRNLLPGVIKVFTIIFLYRVSIQQHIECSSVACGT